MGTTHKSFHGTTASVGSSQGHTDGKTSDLPPEKKPWLLPEKVINSLSGEFDPCNKYPLFIATRPSGLDCNTKNFCAEFFFL